MSNKLWAGVWRTTVGVPPFLWEKQIERKAFSSGRKNMPENIEGESIEYGARILPPAR